MAINGKITGILLPSARTTNGVKKSSRMRVDMITVRIEPYFSMIRLDMMNATK